MSALFDMTLKLLLLLHQECGAAFQEVTKNVVKAKIKFCYSENCHHNKLHKLFNRTNVKISYSCMPNMNSYTYMHNHKVLNDKPNEMGVNNCNCRNKDNCPLPNSCQTKCIIYQANIDCDIAGYKQKCYLGSCETTFKDRFGNHKKSFNHLKHKNDTELSKEF